MKKLLLPLTCFLISATVAAQEVEPEEEEVVKISLPNATLKINIPVLLYDPKHAVFLATDTRLAPKWSLDMGVGYYFMLNEGVQYKDESFEGLRGRLGIKYYYLLGQRLAPYIGLEAMWNRFNIKEYDRVCRYGCQYTQTMLVDREVKSNGVAARTGLMIFMGKKKRFFFDVYGGVGYKYMEISLDLPADAEFPDQFNEGFFFFNNLYESDPGEYYVPNAILGIHFGYAFW